MKRLFPAFAAAAVAFTVGSSFSLVAGHAEWIKAGFVVCVVIFFLGYRTLRPKFPEQ